MYNYLDHFNLLNNSQFGFRKNISTSHAIINTLQYIYDNLDEGNTVISFFLDFSKAFDCVDHSILLDKMGVYGVRGIARNWFQSYLTGRQQYVSLNGENSELCLIDRGVPQGSILGPLLFLIFINDFPNCSNFFKFTLFADDSTLSCKFNNISNNQIINTLTLELVNINNWISSNRIKINTNKSNFIIFSYRKKVEIEQIPFHDSFIHSTNSTKFLGIIIDKNLIFRDHINYISSKISKSIGILYRLNYFLPPEILKLLHNSLVLPYLSYGVVSWYGAPRYVSNRVQVLQKKAIRAIHMLPFNSHTNDLFKINKFLKLDDIYKSNLCSHSSYYQNINMNNNITARFLSLSDIHEHNTRHRHSILIPQYHRSKSQASFIFQSIKTWNDLPEDIKNTDTIRNLKSKLRSHYCDLY